jgi:NUMOD3 motif
MNYLKVYHQLISKAQHRQMPNNIYIERHHIVPLSLKGEDIESNIVSLTAKEHFIAHHLLWKIHRNPPMTKAFMLMCNVKRNGIKYKVNAKEYQILKEEFSKSQSIATSSRPGNNLGKKLSQEWKDNISKGLMGRPGGNNGSSGFKGKHWSEEQKKAISERRKGVGTHFTPHTEETKKQMSIDRLGKTKIPWTEERKAARRKLLAEKFSQEKSPD